jgi:hypothetical protein
MEQVAFSHMIFVDGGSLLATVASGVERVRDLSGKRVGVIPHTTTEKTLAAAPGRDSIQAHIVSVSEHGEGLRALEAGQLDAYASDRVLLSGLLARAGQPAKLRPSRFKRYLLERNRRWYGLDLEFVSGTMAEALGVRQSGGFLVKQVAQDSIGERLGLRGGDRLGIVDGQQLIVGGDIVLTIQGIDVATKAGMVQALRTLETLKPGEIMRVNVLRDGRVVELQTPWRGQ